MSYPNPPEIQTSYTAQEQALGDGTLPGQELDTDLASIRASITAVIEFLKTSLRSDGRLANGSVSSDTLASSLIIGFDPPQVWATGTSYTTSSTVFQGFGFYLCLQAHTSGTFATDLASGRWALLADLTPPGGALTAANNLSDLPDKAVARSNLQLGSMATANSGTGASQHRTNLQNEAFFQPLDAELTAIAALVSAANKLPYFTGSGAAALADLTAAGRALLDDADAAAQRTTLGLGALATAASVTTAEIAAATLVTAAETIAANSNDTTIPTSAAVAGYAASKITAGVVYATTSGTSVSIPSVPAGCKRITIGLNGVSTNSTSHVLLQIGDSGGIETTGYQSGSFHSGSNVESTNGFILYSDTAGSALYGSVTLTLVDAATNLWASSHGGFSRTTVPIAGGGIKALSDVITQMQLTTVAGTPTFDGGSVSVVYET